MLSERYPSADVRAILGTIHGLLLAVESVFDELEAHMAHQEADTLSWEMKAARGACALAGLALALETADRAPGVVVALR